MTPVAAPSAPAAAVTGITVEASWLVSRAALARAGHARPSGPDGVLRWRITNEVAVAELCIDGSVRELARLDAAINRDADLAHVTTAQGELALTAADERVLYARTSLLTMLGIPGGRYERIHPVTSIHNPAL